jgi:hypothetical protein
MDNETLQNNILNEIWKLQTGVYEKADIERFDPAITGCGVSVWALLERFPDVAPDVLATATKELANEGSLFVIDPDALGFPSFRATETVTQRVERLLAKDLSRYEVKMVYNIT